MQGLSTPGNGKGSSEQVPLGASISQRPPTQDVERFLSMLRFDSRGKSSLQSDAYSRKSPNVHFQSPQPSNFFLHIAGSNPVGTASLDNLMTSSGCFCFELLQDLNSALSYMAVLLLHPQSSAGFQIQRCPDSDKVTHRCSHQAGTALS